MIFERTIFLLSFSCSFFSWPVALIAEEVVNGERATITAAEVVECLTGEKESFGFVKGGTSALLKPVCSVDGVEKKIRSVHVCS